MYFSYSREHAFKEIGETRQLFIDDDVIAACRTSRGGGTLLASTPPTP